MYAKIGIGRHACGKFVEIKRGMQALSNTPSNNLPNAMINFMSLDSYHTWLAGYLTAVNLSTPDTYNILGAASSLGTADLDEEMLWIEDYCNSNPLNTFANAVQALVAELYPKRTTKDPK